jgi:hypothetical protein
MKDEDHTYQWLHRAYEARSPFMISLGSDPKWSDSQSDPRFQQIWNRMMEIGRIASASPAGGISAIDKVPTDLSSSSRQ